MRIILEMTEEQKEAVNEAYVKDGKCSVIFCKQPLGKRRLVYAQPMSEDARIPGVLKVDFVCEECSVYMAAYLKGSVRPVFHRKKKP